MERDLYVDNILLSLQNEGVLTIRKGDQWWRKLDSIYDPGRQTVWIYVS